MERGKKEKKNLPAERPSPFVRTPSGDRGRYLDGRISTKIFKNWCKSSRGLRKGKERKGRKRRQVWKKLERKGRRFKWEKRYPRHEGIPLEHASFRVDQWFPSAWFSSELWRPSGFESFHLESHVCHVLARRRAQRRPPWPAPPRRRLKCPYCQSSPNRGRSGDLLARLAGFHPQKSLRSHLNKSCE